MLKQIRILLFVIISILTVSCIKEDTIDCVSGLKLTFSYELNNQHKDLFKEQVNELTAFAFDDKGIYQDSYVCTNEELINQSMTLPLDRGRYTIVIWGGKNLKMYEIGQMNDAKSKFVDSELQKGITTLDQFRLLQPCSQDENNIWKSTQNPERLFHGIAEVSLQSGSIAEKHVSLVKNTNTIAVTISGLQTLSNDDNQYEMLCLASNGRYTNTNAIGSYARTVKYQIPENVAFSNGKLTAKVDMLRLLYSPQLDYPARLIVRNTKTQMNYCDIDIVSELMKLKNPQTGKYIFAEQSDFDREDIYNFEIVLDNDDNNIIISMVINGWKVIQIKPGV